jgi:hypothetical protein
VLRDVRGVAAVLDELAGVNGSSARRRRRVHGALPDQTTVPSALVSP